MMLIASLIEFPIAKTRTWQKHKIHLANFDRASLRVIWFRWARFWVAGTSKKGEIDIRRYLKGAQLRCPFTGKIFIAP
jgi:hypothetical protein